MKIKLKDPWSGFTHFVGIVMSIIGLIYLLTRSHGDGSVWHTVSFWVFCCGMILMYSSSTLYHWLDISERSNLILRKIDHIMIFVFISASYTPICLTHMRGPWGWSIFGGVWLITLIGFFIKIFWMNAPRKLSTYIYLLMGWFVVIAIYPLVKSVPLPALIWLLAGGISYSVGAVMYNLKRPNPLPGIFGFHEVFHLFVLAGSFCHYWMVYWYV